MKHTLTRITASLLTFALPLTAAAAGVLTVNDSIAGLGLEVSIEEAEPNAQISVMVTAPNGGTLSMPVSTNAKGNASASIPGPKTEAAGTYTVSALKNGAVIIPAVTATVKPGTMDPWTSGVQSWTPRIHADGRDEADITVTIRDQYGNPLSGRPVSLVSGRSDDSIAMLTPQTDAKGTQHFSLTTTEPGTVMLRAVDLLSGNAVTQSATVQAEGYGIGGNDANRFYSGINATSGSNKTFYSGMRAQAGSFGDIDHFEVTAPAAMNVNEEAPKITIRAVDRNGNTVESYNGTIVFETTDPNATVPNFGQYMFQPRDLGVKSFTLALKFQASGQQILRVSDVNVPDIMGEAVIMVGGSSSGTSGNGITVTSHQNNDYVNTLDIVVEGRAPRLANLIVMGGERDATGNSDASGNFSIPVRLGSAQRDFTIRVMDAENSRTDSGPIHLILDQEVPVIDSITFTPNDPNAGEKVLVLIESEPELAQALMRLTDKSGKVAEITLSPVPTQDGSYQGFFTAPDSGTYQPTVIVMDKAGNTEEVRAQLTVGGRTMPKVQNVKAEARIDVIDLIWDPVTDATGYRVYIGETATDYLYSLDTNSTQTKAAVRGLAAGKTYYFAITALKSDAESKDKSDPVSAQILGFAVTVKSEENALRLTWTSLMNNLPLSAFKLEYGAAADHLTEVRMINGELRDVTIRDLLPGIEYFVKLTPVTVTGDVLDELAATGTGTPTGAGFKPGPRDDVPFDVVKNPGGTLHGAPSTPGSGIPPFAWLAAFTLGALGAIWQWQRRRKLKQTAAFLRAVEAQYGKL